MSKESTSKAMPARPSASAQQAHDKLMQAIARIRQAGRQQGNGSGDDIAGNLADMFGMRDIGGKNAEEE